MRMALYQAIINIYREVDLQKRTIATLEWNFANTLQATGPCAFTHWVLETIAAQTAYSYPEIWNQLYEQPSVRILGGIGLLPLGSNWTTAPPRPDAYFVHKGQVRSSTARTLLQ